MLQTDCEVRESRQICISSLILNECSFGTASRRYQAAEWLRKMDHGASEALPKEPSEEEFCLALRNGLVLCNVLNKVNPGAILKVVENPVIAVQSTEAAAQSAIQYFENMRNFLVAVGDMQLLTFEASDLEKGGSSSKVVDCILCLKGYYEWKMAGGIGVWRYGGTVKITSFSKGFPSSSIDSDSSDESLDESESSLHEQLSEFLHISSEVSIEESKVANVLSFLFDSFVLRLIQAYLLERKGIQDLPLNSMVIDALLRKVVKDFSALFASQGSQLGMFLKKILKGDPVTLSTSEFEEAISQYLSHRSALVSSDVSKFCICGGKGNGITSRLNYSDSHVEVIDYQQKQLQELKHFCKETKLEVKQVQSEWDEEVKRLVHHIKGLEVASSVYHKVLEENRLLYNQVQDLKGMIRVYCRVRPFLPGQSDGKTTVDYIGENGNIMIVNPYKQGKDARKVFSFNKVFGTNVTQQQIYIDTQPLIRSVLDGYNVCIFAYGQTGSGKTYTMSGPDLTTEDTWGVNYRALRDLFQIAKARADVIEYEVGVQMIEIYNEQVRDLLVIDGSNKRLDIRNNSQLNGLNVPDASLIPVQCTRDVLDLMKTGQRNRAVGATALNERSSRSHSILTVHVHGKELLSGTIFRGCLHLVDLAGSERVDKSEAVGERLKEAQHINRSLSALGDVISALAQKSNHIPYRNSKLTQVLQDSLGGQAKTLMFVHINPEVNAFGETISTLKFAERVASIELGAARSNKETGEIRELKEEISDLKLALEKKETELEQLKGGSYRGNTGFQKTRTVSPLHVPRYNNIRASLKPELCQRAVDDSRSTEARSCSSVKQRRSRLPSGFTEPKMPFLAEERSASPAKQRSPSPPIRRSLSTDQAAHIKSRLKLENIENPPIMRLQFTPRISINKSTGPSLKTFLGPQESTKHENISDTFHKVNTRRLHPEHEEEQFKQVLNVRQGGIRKSRTESKAKSKHQIPARVQKSDVSWALLADVDSGRKMEETRKSDFSEPENECILVTPPEHSTLRVKKIQQSFSKNSHNFELRGLVQAMEPLSAGKQESTKFSSGIIGCTKEGSNTSVPDFKRSRSTPRDRKSVV